MFNIEVLGIGFPNKGAELMLAAVSDWAKTLPVPARLAVSWETSYANRAAYGLWARAWHMKSSRLPYGPLIDHVPGRVLERLGVIKARDIHLVLDASGYAYGDPWGAGKAADRLGNPIAGLRKQGKYVVLLPQAFGPFKLPALQDEMKKIAASAHKIYCRDPISLEEMRRIDSQAPTISCSPDFTCLVEPKPFAGMEAIQGTIGLIPNHKMYALGGKVGRDEYLQYLCGVAQGLIAAGRRVVLILHEGRQDLHLCEEINARISAELPIIVREDPREIKMAIRQCDALLTSRFHGFASALFQGVPVLATSWSHKYEQLACEFGRPDLVLKTLDADATVRRLCELTGQPAASEIKAHLLTEAGRLKSQVKAMWQEITALIQPALDKVVQEKK